MAHEQKRSCKEEEGRGGDQAGAETDNHVAAVRGHTRCVGLRAAEVLSMFLYTRDIYFYYYLFVYFWFLAQIYVMLMEETLCHLI